MKGIEESIGTWKVLILRSFDNLDIEKYWYIWCVEAIDILAVEKYWYVWYMEGIDSINM